MEVRMGISTDYAKDKFDITLDETDLARLGNKYGFYVSPAENGIDIDAAYLLLSLEAERYVLVQAPKYGRDVDIVRGQIRTNREQFAQRLSEVTGMELPECRKRAGLDD